MDPFTQFVIFAILSAISILTAPKAPKPVAPSVGVVEATTAEEGMPIPVVFGKVIVQNPNVVWYGDLAYNPIYSESGGK